MYFDHLNSTLPAIIDDSFKHFKDQLSHNVWGVRRYVIKIPKMKTSFYDSKPAQVKSVTGWNNLIGEIHLRFHERLRLSKK